MLSISQRRSLQKRFSEKKEQTQVTKNQDGDPAVIEEEGNTTRKIVFCDTCLLTLYYKVSVITCI